MTLAVYRTIPTRTNGAYYFVAPAGLDARTADTQRVSPYYERQIIALGALIEMQHDYNGASKA
jgi:hypothetical protein